MNIAKNQHKYYGEILTPILINCQSTGLCIGLQAYTKYAVNLTASGRGRHRL